MNKIFDLEVPEGNTSCSDCPFVHNRKTCLYLSESKLCSQYDFTKLLLKQAPNKEVHRFHTEVTNEEMITLLSQYPPKSKVVVECCNPRTMRYNKDDDTIRID